MRMNRDMLQEQLERRRDRGRVEITHVRNTGKEPVYSEYEVSTSSPNKYIVSIRSLSDRINTCTCPDYCSNLIGTCKHIEGVLINLEEKYRKNWQSLEKLAPKVTQIYVHHAERTTIRMTLPFPEQAKLAAAFNRYFDSEGILVGKVTQSFPALYRELSALPRQLQRMFHIDNAVMSFLKEQQDREAVERQKNWFMQQVRDGNRSLDVLSTSLYPFQEEGVLHLAFGRRALLADDMGLGKTVQAIAAAALLKQLRDIHHVLIVCPASLKHQWAREIRRFSSLTCQVIEGNPIQRRDQYRDPDFFNIINYELVRFDRSELINRHFDLVILDEAQRIKNWRTKTAITVKQLKSTYAFVLTGTPLENRLDELFSIFQFIDGRILGPLWYFNERFYDVEKRPSGSYKVLGHKNLDKLRNRILPYTKRRIRDEVRLDLPDRVDSNFFVEMTEKQMEPYSYYEAIVAKLMFTASKRPLTPKEHQILLGSLIKMRLICNALALHDPEVKPEDVEKSSPKLKELREILTEEVLKNSRKAIVFSQWTGMLLLVENILKKLHIQSVKLTGEVPSAKRGALIERFFDDPECLVFLSTDAGGVGLNLQAASMVINCDLPWNPAVLDQRIARAHRHGQKEPVYVVNLIAQGTIEERILDTLQAKRAIFDAALSEESDVTDLSFEDLGQSVLQKLEVLFEGEKPEKIEVLLEPEERECIAEERVERKKIPSVKGFADLLVGKMPRSILLVRKAPHIQGTALQGHGILVVVEANPAAVRPEIEMVMRDYFPGDTQPELMLMEREGYKALTLLFGTGDETDDSSHEFFRSSAIPKPQRHQEDRRRKVFAAVLARLAEAKKKVRLAEVLTEGEFPEEVNPPLQVAWLKLMQALVALENVQEPIDTVPSARLIEAKLVATGMLTSEQAAQLDRIRNLTSPPEEGDDAPPPTIKRCHEFIDSLRQHIDAAEELIAHKKLKIQDT